MLQLGDKGRVKLKKFLAGASWPKRIVEVTHRTHRSRTIVSVFERQLLHHQGAML
jgi:hypothetical protein